ncbi:hypothetical protein A2U01_0049071, partial [Trifolium medium]|nr:hypothetical protein [Trifolium medium]
EVARITENHTHTTAKFWIRTWVKMLSLTLSALSVELGHTNNCHLDLG